MAFYRQWEFWLWVVAWLAFGRLIIIYGFGSPWRESAVGRSLFPMKVALWLLFTWVLSVFMFGHYPGADVLRFLCIGFVTFMALWQGVVWRRIQREEREDTCPRRRATDHVYGNGIKR